MNENNSKKTAEIIKPSLGDIEKVRDILFGKYVASFEERFEVLESRLEQNVEQLTERLTSKIQLLDGVVSKTVEEINERISQENETRSDQIGDMQKMLDEAQAGLQHSISVVEDQSGQELNALKASLNEAQQEFLSNLAVVQKELSNKASLYNDELKKDKVSRDSLALLLDEVAIKLRGATPSEEE